MKTKIAVPTIGNLLDEYLEHCEVFTLYTLDESFTTVEKELLYTPEGCDCKNNIPLIMQNKGVTVMLVFKVPDHAEQVCSKYGIKLIYGYSGEIQAVVDAFANKQRAA